MLVLGSVPSQKERRKSSNASFFRGELLNFKTFLFKEIPQFLVSPLLLAKGDLKLVPGTSTLFFFQSTRWVAGCNDLFVFCFFHQSISKKPIAFLKNRKNPPYFPQPEKGAPLLNDPQTPSAWRYLKNTEERRRIRWIRSCLEWIREATVCWCPPNL